MFSRICRIPVMTTAVLLLMIAVTISAQGKQPQVVPDRWIVYLEAPPTVLYEGSGQTWLHSDGQKRTGPALAATSPAVTGARRLDVSRPEVRGYVKWLDGERRSTLDWASAVLGRELQPLYVYRHLQNGFAIDMSAEEALLMAEVPGVLAVEQDEYHYLETDRGPQLIGADAFWLGQLDGESSHRGENIVIGVIDSGINWDHPMFSDDPAHTGGYEFSNPLGSQRGLCPMSEVKCNNKLIGVYDFTDEGSNGKDLGGHGSHVAGTAAGNPRQVSLNFGGGSNPYSLSGVAPRANIISYKVCKTDFDEDEGECQGSAIREALEQAIEDGVDIINYSLGGTPSDPWLTINRPQSTSSAELFLNLRTAGIVPVSSAGNEGLDGPGTVSSPANTPWTIAVGNTTHDRVLANRASVAGLGNLVALAGTGPSMSSDLSAVVRVAEDVAPGNMLGCNSFPGGAFSNSIAVMMRGDCTFETKVNNAHAAGARGVLIINQLPGPPILMGGLETTGIPSFMLTNDDGLAALEAIANSTSPSASVEARIARIIRPDWADRMAATSGRGPGVDAPDVMKPNVVAPGSSIISASESGSQSAMMTGTSMASPHIAGGMALLKSARPDWSVAMLQSALETTADASSVFDEGRPATMFDRGAGRARFDRAIRAGLYLPISRLDFVNANPANGGDPGQLNLAGIFAGGCTQNCQFTRTVRAISGGSWAITTEGNLDIEVSPASFSLAEGESQELSITVTGGVVQMDTALDGSIVITPESDSMSTQRLPVAMGSMTNHLQINAGANRGRIEIDLNVPSAMPEAVYRTSSLTRPARESFSLPQDSSRSNPYDGDAGTRTFLIDVPEDALMLWVETVYSTAPDIDLFVGFDAAGNGRADENEEVCESITPDELEECLIENPQAGTWWILVQNWQSSHQDAQDIVHLEYAVLTEGNDYTLAVAGPPSHGSGDLRLALAWDQPRMLRDERWLGAIGMASHGDTLADVRMIPVAVRRGAAARPQATAIFAGETYPVVVDPAEPHDLLYFDVSPSASSVSVNVAGDAGVSAQLRRLEFSEIVSWAPSTPPAGGELMATGSGSHSGFSMNADASAGRWYVVLDNSTTSEALVEVTVDVAETSPVSSQRGLWSPRDRLIYQGIEWQRGGPGFLTWYSYDDDGLPVFYQAIAELDATSSAWTASLDRISNATGERQLYDPIGEVSLTMLSDDEMIFAWRRDGFHGSEIMAPDAPRTCPQVGGNAASLSGHWFSPDKLVGGTTMIVTDSVQVHIRYYFDALGVGRWLMASDPDQDPFNEVLELLDFRGFCPGCEAGEVDIIPVGVYTRSFSSDSSGHETLEFVSAAPLNHSIEIDVPIIKLSEAMECR